MRARRLSGRRASRRAGRNGTTAIRDTVRAYWRGDEGKLPELAARLTASADLFDKRGRKPWASINFVAAHDGFTLNDLVSYNDKHNEANGEDNRDGHRHNLSANYGVEGPTDDPEIRATRLRQMRNMLATLLLSRGTPMLLARRRDRAHARAATTTPIARTTRSRGSTGRGSAPDGARPGRVHAQAAR